MAENLSEGLRALLRDHADEVAPDVNSRLAQIADLADERRDSGGAIGSAAELEKLEKAGEGSGVPGFEASMAAARRSQAHARGEDVEPDDLVAQLKKCDAIVADESLPASTRETARKAKLGLEREYVARNNPRAADDWDKTGGVIHGVAG
jgi:hypothetical protein